MQITLGTQYNMSGTNHLKNSCLGCIPPLIGLPSLRFYAFGSSLLCCRPDVITLGNPFDTRVPDYSSSSFFVFFSKNEEEAIPPGGKKYLGTIKASTRMILVHVQKMYKLCTEDVQYI